jgi:hypothetical protein
MRNNAKIPDLLHSWSPLKEVQRYKKDFGRQDQSASLLPLFQCPGYQISRIFV